MLEVFEAQLSPRADRIAVVDGARRVTYGELRVRARDLSAALIGRGVRKGDRVGIFLRRSVDAIAALFATWSAGAVAVILHDQLRTRQVHHILEHSEAALVVTDSGQIARGRHVSVPGCRTSTRSGPWPATRHVPARVIGADLAALIYTSGSTGLPKGVMLSHDNLLSGAQIVARYLELTKRDVILSVLPFSFDYGLNQLMTTILVGGTLVIQRSLFPNDICQTIRNEGDHGPGRRAHPVAPADRTALAVPEDRLPDAPIHHELRRAPAGAHCAVHPCCASARPRVPDVRPHRGVSIDLSAARRSGPPAVIDGQSHPERRDPGVAEGRQCLPGEVGELVHRGANISMGYWRDPESTARVFRPNPLEECRNGRPELVVFSGDLVKTDEEGYLYYVGRKDMQIKSRGVRVSPEEIERCHLCVGPGRRRSSVSPRRATTATTTSSSPSSRASPRASSPRRFRRSAGRDARVHVAAATSGRSTRFR